MVTALLEDALAGRPLSAPGAGAARGAPGDAAGPGPGAPCSAPSSPTSSKASFSSPNSPTSSKVLFSSSVTPPLSPAKPPPSPSRRGARGGAAAAAADPGKPAPQEIIPQFYFPRGREPDPAAAAAAEAKVRELFAGAEEGGLDIDSFGQVVTQVLGLPIYFAVPLFQRLEPRSAGKVTEGQFLAFWREHLLRGDPADRAFECLRQPGCDHLTKEDFLPLLRAMLFLHPGLEFLQDTPEFQDRYAETVIYRLFHGANPLGNGRLTRRELRRSDIVEALAEAEAREDINQVLRYFSYEHFYVIYCRFWELDTDHDFLIDKEDLMRYGGHALTCRAIERIFEQAPRPFNCREPGRMGYEDFVWFILAEENKADERSLEYWFRCADLDGNGALVEHELGWFYEEQLHRMECLGQEAVRFEDILTQLQDMVKPEVPGAITLKDVKRCGMGENFFNVLFNLSKFLNSESRDPFLIRQEREEPHLTAWDRFARAEYVRLSMEGEQADGGGELWDRDALL